MADPNTVTAAELQTLAATWDPTIPANHVYWMMVDAIAAANRGLYTVDYLRMPPIASSTFQSTVTLLAARGFVLTAKSIVPDGGLFKYWLNVSWA